MLLSTRLIYGWSAKIFCFDPWNPISATERRGTDKISRFEPVVQLLTSKIKNLCNSWCVVLFTPFYCMYLNVFCSFLKYRAFKNLFVQLQMEIPAVYSFFFTHKCFRTSKKESISPLTFVVKICNCWSCQTRWNGVKATHAPVQRTIVRHFIHKWWNSYQWHHPSNQVIPQ